MISNSEVWTSTKVESLFTVLLSLAAMNREGAS